MNHVLPDREYLPGDYANYPRFCFFRGYHYSLLGRMNETNFDDVLFASKKSKLLKSIARKKCKEYFPFELGVQIAEPYDVSQIPSTISKETLFTILKKYKNNPLFVSACIERLEGNIDKNDFFLLSNNKHVEIETLLAVAKVVPDLSIFDAVNHLDAVLRVRAMSSELYLKDKILLWGIFTETERR